MFIYRVKTEPATVRMWQKYFHVWGGVSVVDVMFLVSEYKHPNLLGQVSRQQGELLLMDLPLMVGHIQQKLKRLQQSWRRTFDKVV